MGYVKSSEDVAAMLSLMKRAHYVADQVNVEFTSTTDFIEHVLPPCLEPVDEPRGVINVSRWQSIYCGEFDMGCVYLFARHRNIEGVYCLNMFMSGEAPITMGREHYGEPKKLARMGYHHDGPYIYGYVERHGVRLIEVNATLGEDEGPAEAEFHALELKAFPAAKGDGLEYDPLLVVSTNVDTHRSVRSGTAEVTLRGTAHDPLETIPIVSLGKAVHTVGESITCVTDTYAYPDRDAYLPYTLGRDYDNTTLLARPYRYTAEEGPTNGSAARQLTSKGA